MPSGPDEGVPPATAGHDALRARVAALEAELAAHVAEQQSNAFELAQQMATHVLLLHNVPLFKPLSHRELLTVGSKLQAQEFADGAHIITVGDPGDAMFIVETGGAMAVSEQHATLKQYKQGDFFGELSLVNNEPRRATVLAVGVTTCLVLRRDHFHMLKDRFEAVIQQYSAEYNSRSEKLREYKAFLRGTEYFRGLSERALLRLAAQVKQVQYEDGEHVIVEGDEDGHEMFIVETGTAIVSIAEYGQVKICERGDAFGELALVTDAPRKATITVQGTATFLMLRREDFDNKALQEEVAALFRQKLAKYKKDTEKARVDKRESDIALVTEAMVGDGNWSASPAAEALESWLSKVSTPVGLSQEQTEAVRARLEDLGAEALEDLLILAESEKDFLELELFGSEATAAGSRGPTALWAEVVKARAAEESWLRAQAELRVQQRKAAEAERRRQPRNKLQQAAERRRVLAGIAPRPVMEAMLSPGISPRMSPLGRMSPRTRPR